jgi:ribonuclease D
LERRPYRAYHYIDTDAGVDRLTREIRESERVALDTEGNSLHRYYERVCLMQLTLRGKTYIIDPLSGIDLSELLDELSYKPLIFHAAEYDLRILRRSFCFAPQGGVFDTMLAARLLGYDRLGLVALVERLLGVALSKHGQKSDWSRRPLTESQLSYASDDTRYLPALADKLTRELRRLKRLDWHRETCEWTVSASAHDAPRDDENAWRIKGVSFLTPRQLAFVREIWHWREKQAREADLPPFKIMGNQKILDLAQWAESHPRSSLQQGPRLPRTCSGRRLVLLKKAIRRARHVPPSKMPPPRRPGMKSTNSRNPDRETVQALRAECDRLARKLRIDSSVLAPRSALAAIAAKHPVSTAEIMNAGPLMHWQSSILRPAVRRILHKGKD